MYEEMQENTRASTRVMSRKLRKIAAIVALPMAAVTQLPAKLDAQQVVPIRTVATGSASPEHFRSSPVVRQLPNGKVLVHDQMSKRIIVIDTTMASYTVSADSAGTSGTLYPYTAFQINQLIPYLGDSTLFTDLIARTFIVVDPNGKFSRAMSHVKSNDLSSVYISSNGIEGVDAQGRLIYREYAEQAYAKPPKPGVTASTRDTVKLVRADFNARVIDTVASYTVSKITQTIFYDSPGGRRTGTRLVNPLPKGSDGWAVMTDGTIAVIRAHDYHVDFVAADGKLFSGPKLPFDWRRVSDDEKKARIDSMQHVIDSVSAAGAPYGRSVMYSSYPDGAARVDTVIPKISFPPLNEIADYLPPIGTNAIRPDADNKVWILPSTSSQAKGGLLYDVVNRKGELIERVQLPADRVVVGFGKGGVIYMARFEKTEKYWTLERTRITKS